MNDKNSTTGTNKTRTWLMAAAGVIFGLLIAIIWVLWSVEIENLPGAVTEQAVEATPTSLWDSLLSAMPVAHAEPLPPSEPGLFDGTYAKLDETTLPQWWQCRRCADYRPAGGLWRLQFDRGVMRIFYELTGWRSIASFTVSGDRLQVFNDGYCPQSIGEYRWHVEDDELLLEAISDACAIGLRSDTLTMQSWALCESGSQNTGGENVRGDHPGCVGQFSAPNHLPLNSLQAGAIIHGGDSRRYDTPPELFVFANIEDHPPVEGIEVTSHDQSIAYGHSRVLWWNGDWLEASVDLPLSSIGVQFFGDPQIGWARVVLDEEEVWRGDTSAIWSRFGRHGGYVEFLNIEPGPHTIRVESLNFDYHPVTVLGFGFSFQGGVDP